MCRAALLVSLLSVACGSSVAPTSTSPPVTPTGGGALVVQPPVTAGVLVVDRSFGSNGHVDFQIGDRENQLHDVIVTPDQQIVAVGHAGLPDLQMAVARFTSSGELDKSFGNGVGVARIGTHGAFGKVLAVDAQRRIVAGGYYHADNGEQTNILLGRLLPDGRPDPSFGTAGVVSTDLGKSDDRPSSIFVLPDGKLLVVGIHSKASGYETFLARYDDSGTLDPTYGTQGVAYFDPLPGTEFATRALRDPSDGAIVIAGYVVGHPAAFVARLFADGKPDPQFGQQGVTVIASAAVSSAWAVAIEPGTGKIVVGGELTSDRGVVLRLARDGSLDPTWGKQGVALGPRASDQYYTILPEADGSVIGVGFRGLASESRPMLARFRSNGRLDPAFGSHGVLLGPRDGDFLFAGALDNQGRVIGVGMSSPDDHIGGLVMRFARPR